MFSVGYSKCPSVPFTTTGFQGSSLVAGMLWQKGMVLEVEGHFDTIHPFIA